MLSVAEAISLVIADTLPMPVESVALADAHGRVLAEDLAATLTQPPFPAAAMDGYAVCRADLDTLPATLAVIGESAAGHPFAGKVDAGEAVRIFTGAIVPEGADFILIQENVEARGGTAHAREINAERFIRERGIDFHEGNVLLRAGRRLTARDLMLAAQMNHAVLPVRRRPRVALLPSGDELVLPGVPPGPGQIISSIPSCLAPLLRSAGAEPRVLDIAKDTPKSLAAAIASAGKADILVTIGGASVGDHDLVRQALEDAGFAIGFHKVAMRPGKPFMSGRRGGQRVLGLPGNPVSAVTCSIIFLLPLIAALLGEDRPPLSAMRLPLAAPLPANGAREHYMRGKFAELDGVRAVEALPSQDSSLTAALASADCLIVRPPNTPPLLAGDAVPILPLNT
jgi:molybdopterin molybdotransferase